MKIKCPDCGKEYRVDSQRIPAGGASVKCRQCDHVIQISPETSEPVRVIVCPDCAKQYRIFESKLPPHLKGTRCRACGAIIPLIKESGPQKTVHTPVPSVPTPLLMQNETQEEPCSGNKRWVFQQQWFLITGLVAVVLGVCLGPWIGLILADGNKEAPSRLVSAASQEPLAGDPRRRISGRGTGVSGPSEGPLSREALITPVAGIINCPEIQHTSDLSRGQWAVAFTGSEKNELEIISQPGDGAVAEIPGELESTDAPEEEPMAMAADQDERTINLLHAVGLTAHLDESTWREQLSDQFAQTLVPISNHGFGARDAMFLEVDAWGDNASLASVFYQVTQVTSPEGQALEGCVGLREPMVGWRIRVPVQKETPVDAAMIRFEVSVPGDLDAIVMDVSSGHEVKRDTKTGTVAMTKVADQRVRLTYKAMSMPAVYAFDRLGNVLRCGSISRGADGVHMVFAGDVETCLVVGIQHMIAHTFLTRVTLNSGQAVALNYEPEVPRYTRFDKMPLVNYVPVLSLDVNTLAVHWRQEKQQNHYQQILSVDLPENVSVQTNWEVYAHQKDHRVRLNGSSVVDHQRVAYQCRYHGARAVDEMSGSLWLDVCGQIERVTLSQQDLKRMCCVPMPRGKYLDLLLDKNRLSYMVLGGEVIQLAAFDAQGRRLKQDPGWRIEQGMKSVYFWGIPEKVVLDISTQTKRARLDFNMTEPLQESSPLYTASIAIPAP